MIHLAGGAAGRHPVEERLLGALEPRGHRRVAAPGDAAGRTTAVVVPGGLAPGELEPVLAPWRTVPGARLLVLSRLGAHPDAPAPGLRRLWDLEERARASGLPALVLRVAPLLGPASPLWLRLRARPRLPRGGRKLLDPVAEADVVETLDRALAGRAAWGGWFEVAGPEAWSLAELLDLAGRAGPPLPPDAGAWEPPLGELEAQRPAEAGPWLAHVGLDVPPLAERVRAWSAPGSRSAA